MKTLQEYRGLALKRLQEPKYRKRATATQTSKIFSIIDWNYATPRYWPIIDQIERDLKMYLFYDALAMWFGGPMAKEAQDLMLDIARSIFKD